MTNDYLDSVKKLFEYYKMLGEKTFDQVTDDQLFFQYNEEKFFRPKRKDHFTDEYIKEK